MYPRRTRTGRKKREGPIRPTAGPPAEDLELFVTFMNAASGDATALQSPRRLGDWLTKHGLTAADEEISASGLEQARKACAGLRALIAAGTGAAADEDALRELARLTPKATLCPRFSTDGATWLEPASAGLDGLLERLFAIAVQARFESRWPRFKICADGACGRVFYDASRNLNALWCSPRCRSRRSSRYYRQRRSE